MPLEHWFDRPEPVDPIPDTERYIVWVEPTKHARALEIIRRIRRRLVNQRRTLNELTRAYLRELDYGFRREETISDLRARVTELERALEAKRGRSLGNFFQQWFGL